MRPILGCDIGGVILEHTPGEENRRLMNGCIPALAYLNKKTVFKNRIFLVSKIKKKNEKRLIRFLSTFHFFQKTGIPKKHIYFCRERHEKHPICKRLKITHFIDNRKEVLNHLKTVKVRILFNPKKEPDNRRIAAKAPMITAKNWKEVTTKILKTVPFKNSKEKIEKRATVAQPARASVS